MKCFKLYITLILVAFLFISCSNSPKKSEITSFPCGIKALEPKEFIINSDSIPDFIPGKNGVTKVWIQPVGECEISNVPEQSIESGVSYITIANSQNNRQLKKSHLPYVQKINPDSLIVCTLGKDSFPLPVTYIVYFQGDSNLNLKGYSIQNNDTVLPPIVYDYKFPKIVQASDFEYTNSMWNISSLDMGKDIAAPNISCVYQDSKGYLWLSTYPGVCMFDGRNYYLFSEQNGFGSINITSIVEDNAGNIWFGTEGKGVYCFTGEHIILYTTKQGLCHNFISKIINDNNGNLWFFSSWKDISCYTGKSFINYKVVEDLYGKNITAVHIDSKGIMWLGSKFYGVQSFNGVSFTNYYNHGHYFGKQINDIHEDKNGNIWFSTAKGVCYLNDSTITYYSDMQGIVGEQGDFFYNNDSNLCFGSKGSGIICFNGKTFTKVYIQNDLNSNIALDIQKSKSGKIWIGTAGDGLKCFTPGSFITFSTEQGLPVQFVNAITEDNAGNIWFGTTDGFSIYNGKTFKNYRPLSSLGQFSVRNFHIDKKGQMWIAAHGRGLALLKGNYMHFYLMEQGLNNNNVIDIAEDSKGTIWLATDNGINSLNNNVIKSFFRWEGIEYNAVTSISVDSNDVVWFGTFHGLYSYDGIILKNYMECNGLISNEIKSLLHDSKGRLWICTGKGLSCYFNGEFTNFDTRNGLVYDDATSIIEDSLGNFWVGTRNGLSYLIFDTTDYYTGEKPVYIDGRRAYFYNFRIADGIKNLSFYWNAAFIDSKNRIWWGGNKYLTMLNLSNYNLSEYTPIVNLINVVINDNYCDYRSKQTDSILRNESVIYSGVSEFYNCPQNLELPYNKNNLKFYFSTLELNAPNSIHYIYKLHGYESEWSKLVSHNYSEYRNVPPGKYTFMIRAVGASKIMSDIVEYSFEVHPPWWREWWAYFIYTFLIIIAVWIIIQWRTVRLKRYNVVLEHKVKERTNMIQLQKQELEQQNEEILTINNSLNEQKEIVEERNNELNAQNEEIILQRDMLNKQHKEITASIAYAKRIQNAVFPHEYHIDELLPENFIFFKPKDVVSGDFYWIKQVNNKIVIAVADCTGHGVPGAFMSMLGISFLNNIVYKREITEANVILNELRKEIKRALRQTSKNSETRDGMDIALCVLDPKNNKLQYAGAYSPLYLIRNGELSEIKADKMPIGVFMTDINTFSNNELQLQIGDVFYIFSDGFHDQLGNDSNTKYMKSNFKDFLQKIHKKPMYTQKELLETEYINWKKDSEQTDDILIMGVRVL